MKHITYNNTILCAMRVVEDHDGGKVMIVIMEPLSDVTNTLRNYIIMTCIKH